MRRAVVCCGCIKTFVLDMEVILYNTLIGIHVLQMSLIHDISPTAIFRFSFFSCFFLGGGAKASGVIRSV